LTHALEKRTWPALTDELGGEKKRKLYLSDHVNGKKQKEGKNLFNCRNYGGEGPRSTIIQGRSVRGKRDGPGVG